jgi:hypothetical protein
MDATRKTSALVIVAVAAMLALTMGLAGAHSNTNNGCAALPGESEAEITVLEGTEIVYVDLGADAPNSADPPGVYLESNDVAGLQTHDHTCGASTTPADARIV